ncbi:hypothetical protein [Beggiatoa leptomitoformis]|uniref:Uncharacterized protein n=1 Tax=Beggiatoa leptomitoformis TaxID=288004 RepID=A0A2N9YCI0_9GAMM|nr:hypothetical protein [Beggiatoa leptomitoformis]ALG66536.1 hypothetical protein AL038_00775 [Beggiatoa leptomitoformis]AUI68167.1 hypothetical protein BLE401_05270 [Beggiatoa leptomitoformis]
MSASIAITDETLFNTTTAYRFTLDIASNHVTLRELIRLRIYQEVTQYNTVSATHFQGLVQPTAIEKQLNGEEKSKRTPVDWQKQYALALEAFQHNGFIILINQEQITDLDAEITLYPDTQVSFLKLVPLVGG